MISERLIVFIYNVLRNVAPNGVDYQHNTPLKIIISSFRLLWILHNILSVIRLPCARLS